MEDLFPFDDLVPTQGEESPVFNVSFDELPPEVVDLIGFYVPSRSLPNFGLVSSLCRVVARRYLYRKVTLLGNLFHVEPKFRDIALPKSGGPIKVLLQAAKIRSCKTMAALLANKDNIAAVREFRIDGYPSWSDRPYFLSLVKYLWENMINLVVTDHRYFPSRPATLPDPCWSDTLRHLETKHICWWVQKAISGKAMRHLTFTGCTETAVKLRDQGVAHITHLEYLWHEWKEDFEAFNYDWIADAFPNLRALRIGVCSCWVDQNIPEKIYLAALSKLVSNLPHLETFTIGERKEKAIEAEEAFIRLLENAQPGLREITFQWDVSLQPNASLKQVTWRRYSPEVAGVKLTYSERLDATRWSPDPTHECRLRWWLKHFGLPQASRPEMMRRWPDIGSNILSEYGLYQLVTSYVKAELHKEHKCSFATLGTCNCILCTV